jgi:hypothetical protein
MKCYYLWQRFSVDLGILLQFHEQLEGFISVFCPDGLIIHFFCVHLQFDKFDSNT